MSGWYTLSSYDRWKLRSPYDGQPYRGGTYDDPDYDAEPEPEPAEPTFSVDGDEPCALEDLGDLDTDDVEALYALDVGDSVTLGGGAFRASVVTRTA